MDEKRIYDLEHLKAYKKITKKLYGKKIIPKEFQVGDLFHKQNHHKNEAEKEDKGKFETNWFGPYIVKKKYPNGAYKLATIYGK